VLVNVDVDESVARVEAILAAERMRRERQVGLAEFVTRLREGR
jgi:guanylate kinase